METALLTITSILGYLLIGFFTSVVTEAIWIDDMSVPSPVVVVGWPLIWVVFLLELTVWLYDLSISKPIVKLFRSIIKFHKYLVLKLNPNAGITRK